MNNERDIPKIVIKKAVFFIRFGVPFREYVFCCPICDDEILKSGARYCANCGQRLIWEEK